MSVSYQEFFETIERLAKTDDLAQQMNLHALTELFGEQMKFHIKKMLVEGGLQESPNDHLMSKIFLRSSTLHLGFDQKDEQK